MSNSYNFTWHYVKDEPPKKSGWYLVSYADGEGVTDAYWNKQQKTWLTMKPDEELKTVYAWTDKPKPAEVR